MEKTNIFEQIAAIYNQILVVKARKEELNSINLSGAHHWVFERVENLDRQIDTLNEQYVRLLEEL